MARRHFSNTAAVGSINETLNNTDSTTNITLSSGVPTGWPATPCAAVLEMGSASSEEVVLVTSISGNAMTLVRGYNGTATKSHSPASTITHAEIALDFDEANAHVNTTTGVHGVSGAVVGTTDTQVLANKTLVTPVVGDLSSMLHDHSGNAGGGLLPQTSVSGLVGALSAKAADTNTVHITGTETVTGDKNFTGAVDLTTATIKTKSVYTQDNLGYGTFTGTTDASANFVITHGLGWQPSRAFLNTRSPSGGANVGIAVVTGIPDATHINCRMFVLTGSVASLTVTIDWLAIK